MKNQKVIIGLKKAKTSLEKIIQMIEEDKYCIDIIQQNLAVIGLLKSANMNLLEGHMNCCVKKAINSNNPGEVDEKIAELIKIIQVAQNK
ncbi:MAG: metal-sensing transcriptional repressor [Candidatus Gracilibacteria bacterium]|nr:metal-sensing transcriptional repressor [Candidatus Gracilibacteria bacterium]